MATFVLAPDSFKESMTALEACEAMQRAILHLDPQANCVSVPMADGGEGTLDALLYACQGEKVACVVQGPLASQTIHTYFALIDDGQTALIEMAKANGIELVAPQQRNPLLTSTYGTGQMLLQALDLGVKKIILGLGGSITNDGGSGLAQALGVRFLDQHQQPVHVCGGNLNQVHRIDMSQRDARLKNIEIVIASDVTNPLYGENGASYIFGPQKGATPEMLACLDANLKHYATLVNDVIGSDFSHSLGAGAAGGLGFALMAFCGAIMQSGAELVIQQTDLSSKIQDADYVLTGEGKIDAQTHLGKTPFAVAKLAKHWNKPVIAFAGCVGDGIEDLYNQGFSHIIGINPEDISQAQALKNARYYLEQATIAWLIQQN
jgi:glycerate 2-kinase